MDAEGNIPFVFRYTSAEKFPVCPNNRGHDATSHIGYCRRLFSGQG